MRVLALLILTSCTAPTGTVLPYARYQCSEGRDFECRPFGGLQWNGPILMEMGK